MSQMAADISLKPQEYVADLLEEFSDLLPEITKTERSRNLRRNKDGSFIVVEIRIRIYLGKEKSMIVRTIEETTAIHDASNPENGQVVKRNVTTIKYSRDGNVEWSKEVSENTARVQENAAVDVQQPEEQSHRNERHISTIYHEVKEPDSEPQVPSYDEATTDEQKYNSAEHFRYKSASYKPGVKAPYQTTESERPEYRNEVPIIPTYRARYYSSTTDRTEPATSSSTTRSRSRTRTYVTNL